MLEDHNDAALNSPPEGLGLITIGPGLFYFHTQAGGLHK